jgi:hypothetical protein
MLSPVEAFLDTNHKIVKQNELTKIYADSDLIRRLAVGMVEKDSGQSGRNPIHITAPKAGSYRRRLSDYTAA